MTNSVGATSAASTNTGSSASTAGASNGALGSQQVFLQLLVAQMKNQDPLNPADSTTFVTQLAQFSSLEQLIDIKASVDTISAAVAGSSTASANPGAAGAGANATAAPARGTSPSAQS